MHYCITIESSDDYYCYTLLRCNVSFAFIMLPRRHMHIYICNDFLHCWWPSWCFARRTNWLQSWLITTLLATYLYESSSCHTVDDCILHIDYYTSQAYTYVVNYVSRATVNVDIDLSDKLYIKLYFKVTTGISTFRYNMLFAIK